MLKSHRDSNAELPPVSKVNYGVIVAGFVVYAIILILGIAAAIHNIHTVQTTNGFNANTGFSTQ